MTAPNWRQPWTVFMFHDRAHVDDQVLYRIGSSPTMAIAARAANYRETVVIASIVIWLES